MKIIKDRETLIKSYIEFFKSKNHKEIPSSSLIPEHDPTVLFTTAGMHPLVPFLLGQKHPLGKRITSVQKCLRTQDIDEVGNSTHHTFFEMLGNWSLGDYFKKQAISFSYEFLTEHLKIPIEKLAVSCFEGDKDAPKDKEAADIWLSLGIPKEKIAFLPKEENWWGPAGETGPCGPDTEMFYWKSRKKPPEKFDSRDENWVEIWNDVFMQYNKDKKAILVDGMHCLYDKNFNLNKELLGIINSFNTHLILLVNKFREKGLNLIKKHSSGRDTNWEAFSLEENEINKDNPEYFKTLLKKFNLVPEEVIYFDHNKKNLETAKKLGISSKHYTDPKSIKQFIEKNIWAFIPLKQKNVDTGMGVERTLAVLNNLEDNYETSIFKPIIKKIEKISNKKYSEENKREMRIIADHLRAATFILGDERGIEPSNLGQGYVLRRLIRRAIRYAKKLGISRQFTSQIAKVVVQIYPDYPELKKNEKFILQNLDKEEERFTQTLERGLKKFNEIAKSRTISGKDAFLLFQSYGFPIEMTQELASEKAIKIDTKSYNLEFKKHQELSRKATSGIFKSGLADTSEQTAKLHTATHLLHAALRKIISPDIIQKGSNITPERLRFDFNIDRKLTDEEIKKVEDLVNQQIRKALEVKREETALEQAKEKGAIGTFEQKYGEKVSVYSIGNFTSDVCAGPHAHNTSELGKFKITKQESVASGVRRIKAILED